MRYSSQGKQLRLDIFSDSLERSLDPTNRWYKLAQAMPWDEIERVYNQSLDNKHCGGGNKSARMVIGALIIKHKMNLSDEETIQAIIENPYLQYFVGLEEFTNNPISDSSLFVHIRKRIDVDLVNSITLSLMNQLQAKDAATTNNESDDNEGDDNSPLDTGSEEEPFIDEEGNKHQGSIKIDATCCDAEVKYPTDIEVLNDARDVSERLIDRLCALSGISVFQPHIQCYFERFGCYPVKCYADKIYMNRHNREILKKYHIQAAGKPLGRPSKEMQTEEYKQQSIKDMGKRNEVESTFGTAKRVYRANDIRAKLPDTADAWTALCFLVKNVMKFLKELLCALMKRSYFLSVRLTDTDMLFYFLFLKRTA